MKKEIHIMCGGPSAGGIIVNYPQMVVNKDILRYPTADYFITCDLSFLRRHHKQLELFPGLRIFAFDLDEKRLKKEDLVNVDIFINAKRNKELGSNFREFSTGMNSGFTAVQYAILMGYNTIHMYGIDLCFNGSKSHWHNGYGHTKEQLQELLDIYFNIFKEAIESRTDINFISHSPISRLNGIRNVKISQIS